MLYIQVYLLGLFKDLYPPYKLLKLSSSLGLYELLAALPSQLQPHVSSPEDNTFLQDMFGERSLHSLIKVRQ